MGEMTVPGAQTHAAAALSALRAHWGKALLVLLLAMVAWRFGPRWLNGPEVAVETVTQRDFVQTVVASGRVETPHRVDVGVQITGTVQRVPVAEGQAVSAHTPLIELEQQELRAAAQQASVAVEQARARLRQLREVQSPVAEQALRQAQANQGALTQALARSRDLFGQGFIGQAALDEAVRAEQVAQAQVRTARQQLDSTRPAGSDAAVAVSALAQAEAGAELARARLSYAVVKAPVAGTLISRNVEPGDVVQPGKVLMVLSPHTPSGDTQLVVQIDEKNLRLLRVGLQALASADAYPQQRFPAELVYINPGVDAQRGSVTVKLRVPAPPDTLKQDMTVSVDIDVARREHAVLVSSAAVREAERSDAAGAGAGSGAWVQRVDPSGHVRRQAVTLGLRSNGWVEVLAGLQAGDQVVPVGPLVLAEGARVRPVAAASVASAPAPAR